MSLIARSVVFTVVVVPATVNPPAIVKLPDTVAAPTIATVGAVNVTCTPDVKRVVDPIPSD